MEDKKIEEIIAEDKVANNVTVDKIEVTITEPKLLEAFELIGKNVKDIEFKGLKIHGDSEQTKEFMDAYSKYFAEITNPKNVKENIFLKNKYAPLDEVLNTVRPIMGKFGLSVIQIPSNTDGGFIKVDTLLMHEGGCMMAIEGLSTKAIKGGVQEIGSIITYLRRYALSTISGVASEEDDDGNDASGKKATVEKEDPTKFSFVVLKAKTTELAKAKMESAGKEIVQAILSDILGKGNTVSKSTEDTQDKIIELYNKLHEL